MKCSLRHENALRKSGCRFIAGIDEAGRGPLAGPVVAAVVILPARFTHRVLTDSKRLGEKQREEIYSELTGRPDVIWAAEEADVEEIDRINICGPPEAMRARVLKLSLVPDHALIDGLPVRPFPSPDGLGRWRRTKLQHRSSKRDRKVTRDRIMLEMDARHPGYEFSRHKGYATEMHLERLNSNGPCAIHRRSFLPVRQTLLPFA
jgi:ribonuclease HII